MHPAIVAHAAATAQSMLEGRFFLGVGTGENLNEHITGAKWPALATRRAMLDEAIELMRLMWTSSPASYKGEHYQISQAYCEPRPNPIPPVMIGGHGEKYLLRCVAEHADWWNYSFRDMPTYVQKQEALKAHCLTVKRDYDSIEQVGARALNDIHLIGTPAQVTDTVLAVIKQGARRLTVNFADVPNPEGTWLFASTVLPQLA